MAELEIKNLHVRTEDEKRLHQVIRKRIVVIDKQQARFHKPSSASTSARLSAALLASTSSCSVSGTLSATMPAPA